MAQLRSPGDVGLAIQQARLAQRLSQTALADQLGISQRSVSEIESGRPTIYGVELTATWDDGRTDSANAMMETVALAA